MKSGWMGFGIGVFLSLISWFGRNHFDNSYLGMYLGIALSIPLGLYARSARDLFRFWGFLFVGATCAFPLLMIVKSLMAGRFLGFNFYFSFVSIGGLLAFLFVTPILILAPMTFYAKKLVRKFS